jgi:hypothetical protein
MKKLLLIVYLFSLTVPGLAQQGATGVDGLEFIAPLEIGIGKDNGFLVDRSEQLGVPDTHPQVLDDTVLTLTMPKIGYQNTSRRHEFVMTWLPEFEIFKHNGDQNSFNQQALASFNYYLKRNLQVWVAESYKTSKDPARSLSNVFLLLPRSRYRENAVHASLEFQPSARTNLAVQFDNGYSSFGHLDPFKMDSRSSGYSISLTRLLRRHDRIRATYSLFKITPINLRDIDVDGLLKTQPTKRPINTLTLQYKMGLNPTTVLEFSGGLINLDTGTNYTFQANFGKRFGELWAGGGYSRTLAFNAPNPNGFVQSIGGNGFYDVIVLRLRGQLTRDSAILAETTMSRDASNRFIDPSKSLMGRIRYDYRLSDNKVWFATWESYQQTRNVFVQAPLARNRFVTGVEISLSSETERRTSRLNEDAEYVALTDHGRRRKTPENN